MCFDLSIVSEVFETETENISRRCSEGEYGVPQVAYFALHVANACLCLTGSIRWEVS
jgi:hypothetical protein